ncbi:MAG: DUF2971 domain-containing protein [Spirochaetes bacterium]|nr:DUF2971 domain-containing protein [Spirochaetota bacterium]
MNDLFTELTTLTEDFSFDDNYLFHYTDADTFINKILKNRNFLFNAYKNVRDPFEYKKKSYILDSNRDPSPSCISLNKKITDFINNEIRTACFCLNYRHIKNNDIAMSRGFSKSRMWAACASQHSGVCLVFDKNRLIENVLQFSSPDTFCAKKVRYTNDIYLSHLKFDISAVFTSSEENISDAEIFKNYKKYFFIKDSDYEDADEFRIIFHDNSEKSVLLPYKDCLKAVIIGDNFNKNSFNAIKEAEAISEIQFFEYYFHDFIYKLRKIDF